MKRFLVFIIAIALVLPNVSAFANDVDPLERIAELEEQLKERDERIAELENQVNVLLDLIGKSSKEEKEPERIELTTDNVQDYITISKEVSCSIIKTQSDVYGFPIDTFVGDATLKIHFVNQSDAKFENVSVQLRLSIDVVPDKWKDGEIEWVFSSGNFQNYYESPKYNYKNITIFLPYDGNYTQTEDLNMSHSQSSVVPPLSSLYSPDELYKHDINMEIVNVSGSVILK